MRSRRRLHCTAAGVIAAICVLATGCTSTGSGATGSRVAGGTATVAELPESPPNYIFPFASPAYSTVQNMGQFQNLMYRPLYWLDSGNSLVINGGLSTAETPTWNQTHNQVRITLKNYRWSDGSPLTPRNVAFWIGLARAEKQNLGSYTPGEFPDNLKSVTYNDTAGTVTFDLTSSVSPDWFLYDQLATITPLPLAWDKTGASAAQAGCSSEDPAIQARSCPKVYDYLNSQAKDLSTYATNPLWQVVDGPFKLKSFSSQGNFSLVPNPAYSGSPKPSLSEIKFVPFTSEAAEYDALRAGGSLSLGYAAPSALRPKAANAPAGPSPVPGYTLDPDIPWGFSYILINFNNPTVGPVFRQLYVRQALQSVVDQSVYIEKAANGYGTSTYGPVPLDPPSAFTRGMSEANPYPFSISHAKALLTTHGWSVPESGPAACEKPGTGPGECGADIKQGQRLTLKLESFSGSTSTSEMMSQFSSDASQAGINIEVSTVAPQQMVADATQCKPTQSTCSWQLVNYGSALLKPYPSGALIFQSGAGTNIGSYSDPTTDTLIRATLTSSDSDAIAKYASYTARQVPVIWQPTMARPVYDVKNTVKGIAPISPLYNLTPEYWYLTK